MGVKGLQFYLERCCTRACPYVNIEELIMRQRRSSKKPLLIVVDGLNCIRKLYADLEWVGGGQFNQYVEKLIQFVEAFNKLGVRLVVFFDGPTVEEKRRTWIERRMQSLNKTYYVLDEISYGASSLDIPKYYFCLPAGIARVSRIIFKNHGCEVFKSLTECDMEIVEYARSHQAVAILAQDTDYVIFNLGSVLYMSIEHLNLETMTTRLYDRWELARSLRIHPSQLPLLATLMGNDIISPDDLKQFHHDMTGQPNFHKRIDFRVLVPSIASYIRSLPYHQRDLYNFLPEISIEITGTEHGAEDILNSLHSYDSSTARDCEILERHIGLNEPWSQLVAEAERRHRKNQLPGMAYAVMSGLPFESSSVLEDFRKSDIPAFASSTAPLRARIYGILLQEKPLPPIGYHEVKEWCMAGPGSLEQPRFVQVVNPSWRHPGLMTLWRGRGRLRERWSQDARYSLLVKTVSSHLVVAKIRSTIPTYLIIPTLALFFINELNFLSPWEIDAMLATAVCLKHYNLDSLAALPADPILPRGIRVANFIMRCVSLLYDLLAICGYPIGKLTSAPWLFYDGKLFQVKYNWASEIPPPTHAQLCEYVESDMEDFQFARSIIFNN